MKYAFKDIASNCTEKRIPTEEDRLTYIGLEHLDSRKLAITRYGSDVPLKGEKLVMKKGDILFGKRNTYLKRVAIAPFDGLFSAHGMVLRPNEKVISKEFFPFFLSSDYFLDEAIRISVGSLSPTVNWKDLRDLVFEIPDFEKQHELALFLSSATELKESYEKMIAATDEMVKSQFIEMFGDPITNSKGRKQKPFIEVVTLHRGYDLPEGKRVQSGSIPIYGANGFLGYHDCAMSKDGIVTGRSGAIGEVYEVPGPYWPLNTALFSIDTHGNNITYLTYLLRFFDIKRFGTGTGVPTLNRNDVHKEMIYDVELTEQSAFEKIAKQADKSKFDGLKSQFIEMFGGSDYPKQPLGNLCKILAGKTLPLDVENEGGPIAYIKVADMNLPENDRVVTTSTRHVTEETAKISGILPKGATVFPKNGAAALHNKKRITAITTCVDMNTMGVYSISESLDPEFLYAFLVHQDVASLTLTGAIPQIRPKDIAALEIPLPPLERQRAYIGMVRQADKSKYLS